MSSATPSRRDVLRLLSRASVGLAAGAACSDDGASSASDAGGFDAGSDPSSLDAGALDVGSVDTGPLVDAVDAVAPDVISVPERYRFALVADTHVRDEYYTGPEGSELDTATMELTNPRFTAVADRLAGLETPVDFVLHVGDLVHDYPPDASLDWLRENRTRLDIAKDIIDRVGAPFYFSFGNHDYDKRQYSLGEVHELFAEKFGFPVYGSHEHHGMKFVMLNGYLGEITSSDGIIDGAFGEEQLNWLEGELQEGKPTFICMHQMLTIQQPNEVANEWGIHTLMERYKENILHVVAGHTHTWLNFGPQFGPNHFVMGATRYDEDCFIVAEVETATQELAFLNEAQWRPLTREAERWEES